MRVSQLVQIALIGGHVVSAAPTDRNITSVQVLARQESESTWQRDPEEDDFPPSIHLEVKCDHELLTDAYRNPSMQWFVSRALTASYWARRDWEDKGRTIKWPNHIANFFKIRPSLNCQDLENENCQVTINCGQGTDQNAPVDSPAGYIIGNSMISVHNFYESFYKGLKNALTFMTGDIGSFSQVFAPQYDPMKDDKIALDILNMFFTLISAPTFNSWIKRVPFFKQNPNLTGTIKDTTNGMTNQAITMTKDSMTAINVIKTQNDISSYLTSIVKTAIDNVARLNEQTFLNPDIIYNLMESGKVFDMESTPSALDITKMVEKSLWATMIPYAWMHSSVGDGLMFIMNSDGMNNHDGDCKFNGEPEGLWAQWGQVDNAIEETKVCIDGKPYWLVAVNEPRNGQCEAMGFGTCPTPRPTLRVPPGLKDLDGKKWGGLTKEDLVRSALSAYKANGDKNGWAAMDVGSDAGIDDIVENGPLAKGVVNIPICSRNEAANNAGWSGPNGQQKDATHYPCN